MYFAKFIQQRRTLVRQNNKKCPLALAKTYAANR